MLLTCLSCYSQRSKTSLFKHDFVRFDLLFQHISACSLQFSSAGYITWMLIARLTRDNNGKKGASAVVTVLLEGSYSSCEGTHRSVCSTL